MHGCVLIGVVLPGFFGMMGSVQRVSVGDVGVVPGLLVIARFVMVCRFPVMFGGVLMMLRRFVMMLCSLVSHWGGASLIEMKIEQHQGVYRRNLIAR